MRYSKILVPLDGSELAERVVASALQLAEAMDSTVTLLTVISHKSIDDPDLVAKAVQSGAFEADLYLRSVKKHFLPTMTPIETAVIIGKPEKGDHSVCPGKRDRFNCYVNTWAVRDHPLGFWSRRRESAAPGAMPHCYLAQ
ncbi:MAG: universal stress protein [Chloroflexi bacterium]|nr:universal stress protein [Chloroflexota bacterium]